MESSYSQYLLAQLKRLSTQRKVVFSSDKKFASIQCPNPGHKNGNETHPSCRINIVQTVSENRIYHPGSAKCFSCGVYYKNWKTLTNTINRPDLANFDDQASQADAEQIRSFFDKKTEGIFVGDDETQSTLLLQDLQNAIPWEKQDIWRGISGRLMHKLGAKMYFDSSAEDTMAYLPCAINKREVGGIRAKLEKQGKLNYFNTPGNWTKNIGLFPYDLVHKALTKKNIQTMVLMEGPRDAMNSIQMGIPALAILGSNNWSEVKADLVTSLPINRVITCFDPDEAGDKAKKLVYSTLKDVIEVKNFDLKVWHRKLGWSDKNALDPGNMPQQVARAIRKHIH